MYVEFHADKAAKEILYQSKAKWEKYNEILFAKIPILGYTLFVSYRFLLPEVQTNAKLFTK